MKALPRRPGATCLEQGASQELPAFCIGQRAPVGPGAEGCPAVRHVVCLAVILVLFCSAIATAAQAQARFPAPALQGVLFISLDSFRADRVSAAGYPRPTTPKLDRFAAEAVRFDQAISQSAWTSPGLLSLLTGLYPSVHGMDARGKRLDGVTATPLHHLRRAGFRVLGYASKGDNFADLGFALDRELRSTDHLFAALREVKGDRFFFWYHFRITHLPYNPLPQHEALFPAPMRPLARDTLERLRTQTIIRRGTMAFDPADRPGVVALYDSTVRKQDEALGTVFANLDALGLSDRTLVVVVADHGEELLDHGFVGHASTSLAATLHDEILRIPLMIRVPGSGLRGIVGDQVQQIDVMPTLFELLRLKAPGLMQGRSLVPLMRGARDPRPLPAFSETNPCGWQCPEEAKRDRLKAVRTPEWKLIKQDAGGAVRFELYHLANDPGEQRDIAAARPDVVRRLKTLLERQERKNQQVAARIATEAGETLLKRARRHVDRGDPDEATRALERIEHLRYVYETQNPPFTRDPALAQRWLDVVARAQTLLGRLSQRQEAPRGGQRP